MLKAALTWFRLWCWLSRSNQLFQRKEVLKPKIRDLCKTLAAPFISRRSQDYYVAMKQVPNSKRFRIQCRVCSKENKRGTPDWRRNACLPSCQISRCQHTRDIQRGRSPWCSSHYRRKCSKRQMISSLQHLTSPVSWSLTGGRLLCNTLWPWCLPEY